ncbi:prevent-host-death protein [Paramagnetospirillum kuznetsovii]|uniref:Prevent-host-death protein n=1 Tax=Paramagnetospirillum kuznetsovii TaxID=2053833 RepID=A0A364NZG3_9PROT|nr:type II toxin-antitoxin system Phd/YefM family antitoxin [Paramagnetospirillum kuznetsovii]RAU22471.1 prevent-host-death protein [Paramagnetospirillum kuznetsovii]
MIVDVDAQTFRSNLGDMINRVQYRGDCIALTKDGKHVATLIDTGLFQRVREAQRRLVPLAEGIAATFAAIPAEDGIANLKAMAAEVQAPGGEG